MEKAKVTAEGATGQFLSKFFDVAIPADFPSPADDYREEEIDVIKYFGLDKPSVFWVRASGDSMDKVHIADKAIVAVDKAQTPRPNDIIVGILNSVFTIKRLVKTPKGYVLHPESNNGIYKPLNASASQKTSHIYPR